MKRLPLENSTILIVGGAGFIGSHLVDHLLEEKTKEIIIIDNLFTGTQNNLTSALAKNAILYIDNAENQEALNYIMEKHTIDIVFNCATKPLNYSFMNPADAFLTNVIVLKNLLELQRKELFHTLCHFSSSEAYGSSQYQPMDENHPLDPTTTYAAGKAAADLMLTSYVKMFNLDAFIVRPFNNYGPRQSFTGPLAGVIPTTIKKILADETPEIHGTGQQTRDYIYVKDTVDMVVKLYPLIPSGDTVNITTDQQLSIQYIIETIIDEMNYTGEVLQKPNRKSDVTSHRGSIKKLQKLIGTYNKTDFKDGIASTINWVKRHVTK
ncbi:dTDP-glucose 4,6-dehydratase [Virgibacillus chiguensis]|uniref:UDP-glucose 4-epimerase n=1 Tax=Virgibacillus chiguensis TaxID=411959 RepID=A0A1M5QAT2_9BACI|nr:NAD-dependent epimerase/dehydratase family protein [Virgibacillus chiguensis]SHH11078.1 UDP-glucose 4-epimerase [Virgibacillus chiguensis]